MKLIDQQVQVASIDLAGALLRAWMRADRHAFEAELDRSSRTSADLRNTGETERLEMLNAIAERLRGCADPFATGSQDLGIGVCVGLLSHLACPGIPERVNRAGYSASRSARRFEMPDSARSRPILRETLTLH